MLTVVVKRISTFPHLSNSDEWNDNMERMPYDTGKLDMADKMDIFFDSLVNVDQKLEKVSTLSNTAVNLSDFELA